jgi:hypothetical protein
MDHQYSTRLVIVEGIRENEIYFTCTLIKVNILVIRGVFSYTVQMNADTQS